MRLWSVWKDRQHIGYALGDYNKSVLQRVMGDSFRFYPSSYPVPSRWAKQWIAVWKHGNRAQWGAFLRGWNVWITWQLQRELGYSAAKTRDAGLTRVATN